LAALLENVENSGCAAMISSGANSPWQVAFDATFSGIAATFSSKPVGKNRCQKFRKKTVQIWEAMERAIRLGEKSETHPLYRLAMKQLATYRSLATPTATGKRGRPRKVDQESWLQQARHVAGLSACVPDMYGTATTSTTTAASVSTTTTPRMVDANRGVTSSTGKDVHFANLNNAMLDVWKSSLLRLETALAKNQAPVLPSPLHELHQIKSRTTNPEELELLEPHYQHALGNFLTQAATQAATSAHPAMLPSLLEGLDALRQQVPHDQATLTSIQYTYTNVLRTYLQLLHPSLPNAAATPMTAGTDAPLRKKKRSLPLVPLPADLATRHKDDEAERNDVALHDGNIQHQDMMLSEGEVSHHQNSQML
jgi:hypothetical protein